MEHSLFNLILVLGVAFGVLGLSFLYDFLKPIEVGLNPNFDPAVIDGYIWVLTKDAGLTKYGYSFTKGSKKAYGKLSRGDLKEIVTSIINMGLYPVSVESILHDGELVSYSVQDIFPELEYVGNVKEGTIKDITITGNFQNVL